MTEQQMAKVVLKSWDGVKATILKLDSVWRAIKAIPSVRAQGVFMARIDLPVFVRNDEGSVIVHVEPESITIKVRETADMPQDTYILLQPSSYTASLFFGSKAEKYLNEYKVRLEGIAQGK